MAAHRYWRIWMTAAVGASYAFSEIQFRTTAGTSLAFSSPTPATAGQTFGGVPSANDATHAADGNTSTLYSSIDKTGSQWWAYDFGATSGNWRDVVEIAITARIDSNANAAPSNFIPQWSDDGSAWNSMQPVVTAAWTTLGQVQALAVGSVSTTFTAWNPVDATAAVVLTNSNRTATNSTGATADVRSVNSQLHGKFYWEHNVVARASTSGHAAGVWAASVPIASNPATGGATGICGVQFNGNIYVDGVLNGIGMGAAIPAGTLIPIAVDCDAQRIWFRLGAAGNWNGSGTANPATGTGGVTITVGNTIALYAGVWLVNINDQVTANFGDTAFSGAVPAGFTSGFTIASGATGSTSQARALIMA